MKKYKILALVFAILTGISVFLFLSTLQKSSQKNDIEVVVAAKPIDNRTVLTEGMLRIEKIPAEAVHPDAARNIEQVAGLITDGKLEQGEMVLRSKLLKSGGDASGLSCLIPAGMRAATIQVDSVSGVGGFLKIGDRVDILVELDLPKANSVDKVPTSVMLLQNIEILAVGSNSSGNSGSSYTTVTIAVKSDNDVLKLNLAAADGKIRLVLRPTADKKQNQYTPQTEDSLR